MEGKGLFGLAGFIELDAKSSPAEVATQIVERLALNEGKPRDHYTRETTVTPEWPVATPLLDWPVADHSEAQRAFGQLITRDAPFRLLPIHGRSDTGKSHLTKQFLRNALKIPDLTCGRFDFKGSSDMDAELRAFAGRLGVPEPHAGDSVSVQLGQVFGAVSKTARPTLLIFDTFEMAGEAGRWVKDSLLLQIVNAKWLRIIIVGQSVAVPDGEAWAGESAQPIELHPPSPEEWFAYGKSHNSSPQFTIELIRSVHALVQGKSSVIAQLCRAAN